MSPVSSPNGLVDLDQQKLAQFASDAMRRMMLHYGFWFNEVHHQLGLDEAISIEQEVAAKVFPNITKRFSQVYGFKTDNDIPESLIKLPREKLIELINALAVNWLANDGIWFLSVEKRHGMFTAKRCNDTCWARFSPLEAGMIKSLIGLPSQGGLESLGKALKLRLYAFLNEQSIEIKGNELIFKMIICRVQDARKRKGLEDYPCKSAGTVEYQTFASAVDSRIKTECIACPPDKHPAEWFCGWRFFIP